MSFFRKAKKKIVKSAEKPKEEAEASLEPEKEFEPEPIVEKPEWWHEFQELREQWRSALEHAFSGFPNVLSLQQDGKERFFYVLQNLGQRVEPGKSSREMRCLCDDFQVFNVQQTFQSDIKGLTNMEVRFERLDARKIGLDPNKVVQLVKEILSGSTPVTF